MTQIAMLGLDAGLVALLLVIVLGLAFDFSNGFHDSANAIATSVATRVLSPHRAVLMAGILNFVGAFSGTRAGGDEGEISTDNPLCLPRDI